MQNNAICPTAVDMQKIFKNSVLSNQYLEMCLQESAEDRVFLVQIELLRNQKAVIRVCFDYTRRCCPSPVIMTWLAREGSWSMTWFFYFLSDMRPIVLCLYFQLKILTLIVKFILRHLIILSRPPPILM